MFTNHIHAYVIAMMYLIFVQYDALMTLLLNVNPVPNPLVGHGHSGHHGQPVQNHVVAGKDHVIELSLGTMVKFSLKLKPPAAIQVKFNNSHVIFNKTNLDACPHWGKWKAWSPCSGPCYEDGKPKPTQNRYRCWTINGVEDCGSGSGHAHYDYDERTCNTNNKCVAVCEWSNWGQWSACNPDCKKGYRIQRRTNNEDSEGASCIGVSLRTELCGDNADDECEECFDKYDKCNKISTSFCTDVRYAARMKSLCHKHCGCESRKRRSNDDVSILNENDHDAIQSIEFLALAMIKDSPRELSSFENDSRLRRSADLEDLNEVYSTIVERFEEVDVLLEGKV